jgi:hypothetical protein
MSAGVLENMQRMRPGRVDNVLLEWCAAIELNLRGVLDKIVPLFLPDWAVRQPLGITLRELQVSIHGMRLWYSARFDWDLRVPRRRG